MLKPNAPSTCGSSSTRSEGAGDIDSCRRAKNDTILHDTTIGHGHSIPQTWMATHAMSNQETKSRSQADAAEGNWATTTIITDRGASKGSVAGEGVTLSPYMSITGAAAHGGQSQVPFMVLLLKLMLGVQAGITYMRVALSLDEGAKAQVEYSRALTASLMNPHMALPHTKVARRALLMDVGEPLRSVPSFSPSTTSSTSSSCG